MAFIFSYQVSKAQSAGAVDPTFNPQLPAGEYASALLVDGKGRLLVGTATGSGALNTSHVLRLLSDGTSDPSFQPVVVTGSKGATGIWKLLELSNGEILAGGIFSTVNGRPVEALTRVKSDGTVAPSFDAQMGHGSSVNALGQSFDGKLYVGGQFSSIGGGSRNAIARITLGGSLDTSFDGGPSPLPNIYPATVGFANVVTAILTYSNVIYISGVRISNIPGLDDEVALVALGTSGQGFGGTSSTFSDLGAVNDMAALPNGKIVAAGSSGIASTNTTLNSNLMNLSFGLKHASGYADVGPVNCLLAYADGRFLAGGAFTSATVIVPFVSGQTYYRRGVLRLNAEGSVDTDFDPGAGAEVDSGDASVECMAFEPDGSIVVGGIFSRFGGLPRIGIARLIAAAEPPKILRDPVSIATVPGSLGSLTVFATGTGPLTYQWMKNGTAIPNETRSTLGFAALQKSDSGTYSVRVTSAAGVAVSGNAVVVVDESVRATSGQEISLTQGTSYWTSEAVMGVEPDNTFYAIARGRTCHYLADGAMDLAFSATPNQFYVADVGHVTRCPDGTYCLTGQFQLSDSNPIAPMVLMSAAGVYSTPSWVPSKLSYARRVQWQPGHGILLWGSGGDGTVLLRMSTAGEIDLKFSPPQELVSAEGAAIDGVGNLYVYRADIPNRVRKFDPDGKFVSEVTLVANHNISPHAFVVQPDGKLLIGEMPSFPSYPNQWSGVSRFWPDGRSDESFSGPLFTATFPDVDGLYVLADGTIWVSGSFVSVDGAPRRNVARLLPNGAFDPSFDLNKLHPNWAQYTPSIKAVFSDAATPAVFIGSGAEDGPLLLANTNSVLRGSLTNLSTRAAAGQGEKTLIAGFIVSGGSGGVSALVRAVGPGLSHLGVGQFDNNPTLDIYEGSKRIGFNAGWDAITGPSIAAAELSVGAFPLDTGSKDSAFLGTFAPGNFTAVVSNDSSVPATALVEVYRTSATVGTLSQFTNISTRGWVGNDADVLIAGFTIQGGSKNVLIRAVAATLPKLGVPNVLGDPRIRLYRNGVLMAENDDWHATASASAIANAGERAATFALDPIGRDAAWVGELGPGGYTAIVSGSDNGTGVALVEVYALDP